MSTSQNYVTRKIRYALCHYFKRKLKNHTEGERKKVGGEKEWERERGREGEKERRREGERERGREREK